ncbi:MAG: hypothetical protein ACKVZ0_02985 [Gemmatimonadales bacterium]
MTKSRWVATGLLSLAFALGGLVGGTATMLADRSLPARGGPHGTPRAAYKAQMRQDFIERLRTDIELTPAQERAVLEVLDRHEPILDSLWRTVRTQFDAERQAVRRDIRMVLEAGQQSKYDVFNAKRDSARRAREAGRD